MSADLLTVIPRRGMVRIRHRNLGIVYFEGWFHTEQGDVMRRGALDVRSWNLCPVADVLEFTPDPVQP